MSIKRALITGGTKGIGFGIAEQLLKNGYAVIITGRTKENVDVAVGTLQEIAGKKYISGFVCDVRNAEDCRKTVDQIRSHSGNLDVVIANAGVGHFGSIEDISEEAWEETIQVNLTGVFNTLKASIKDLKETKGYFITIASLAGTNFFAGGAAYNASKFGLVGFSQAAMMDLRKYGIKVTTIMPGSVTSHFNGHIPSEEDAWKIQPEDIGQIIVDLLKMHPRTLPSKIEVRPAQPK